MAWVFNKTLWVQDNPPYVTAAQLNRIETGIDDAGKLADSGMTKIADAVLSEGGTSLIFANIPQTFTHLRVYYIGQSQRAGMSNTGFRVRCNLDGSALYNFYNWTGFSNGAAAVTAQFAATQQWGYLGQAPALTRADNNCVLSGVIEFPYYIAPHYKFFNADYVYNDGSVQGGGGMCRNTWYGAVAPITNIRLSDDVNGILGPMAKAQLYGVK